MSIRAVSSPSPLVVFAGFSIFSIFLQAEDGIRYCWVTGVQTCALPICYFPPYEAVFLTRRDALARVPALPAVLQKLGGAISTDEMRKLNYEVDGRKRDKKNVIREWLIKKGL